MKITTINDYVDKVALQFPFVPKDEIKRILVYGWKMILLYLSAGNDIYIQGPETYLFIGKLTSNALLNFKNYCYKLAKRIQYMFRRTLAKWDGYYYFGLLEEQYIEYEKLHRKKYKVFENIMLYGLLDELLVSEHAKPYIFRLKELHSMGFKKFYPKLKTDKAELIIQRDPLNMDDLMTSKNKYKYILV